MPTFRQLSHQIIGEGATYVLWAASGHLEVVSVVIVIVLKLPLSMVAHRCTAGGLKRKVGNDPDGVRSLI